MPRPVSQQRNMRRRNPKTDAMKTAAGFYPRERNSSTDETIEIIKVEPNKEDE
jgi:hypothetical protein